MYRCPFASRVVKKEQEWCEKKSAESPKKKTQQQLTELRMRKTQTSTQAKKFFDIWSEFNQDQVNYRDKSKKMLVKRCKITNNSFSEDQIEQMLDDGNTQVFAGAILNEEILARKQLSELQDRHDEFIKLEKSIKEVHDMFLEVAALVQQQGEMVDNIHHSVMNAEDLVEKGKGHLNKARLSQIAARKKKICFGAILAVIILIVVIVVLSEFGVFSGGGGSGGQTKIVYVTVTPEPTTTTTKEPPPY